MRDTERFLALIVFLLAVMSFMGGMIAGVAYERGHPATQQVEEKR